MPELILPGCTSEPLLSYLKALGVLRLVAEQLDPDARGCWRETTFCLQSTLDGQGLIDFFFGRYEASPILSPWNKDGGFLDGKVRLLMEGSSSRNWVRLREAARAIGEITDSVIPQTETKSRKKALEERKDLLRRRLRAESQDSLLEWLDACFVLVDENWRAFPLLGSGGNDGRLDYSAKFLEHLASVLPADASSAPGATQNLEEALLAVSAGGLRPRTKVGQFLPAGAGGPNLTTGFGGEDAGLVNPWDFVLGMEGTLLLRGGTSRRLDRLSASEALFPFSVSAVPELGGQVTESEDVRSELWLPLWGRPARLAEIRALFAEARTRVGKRPARNNIEMARAAVSRGVDRGIRDFQRFSIAKRNGKSYFAVSTGRFRVRDGGQDADLLREIDGWLEAWRRATRQNNKPPAPYVRALRGIDRAAFSLCAQGGAPRVQDVLVAIGRASSLLGIGRQFREESRIPPLSGLSPAWIERANDGSHELSLALGLATWVEVAGERGAREGGLRGELEPIERDRFRWRWAKDCSDGGLLAGDPLERLLKLLQRLLQDAESGPVFFSARLPCPLVSIADFLEDRVDLERVACLTHALLALKGATDPLPRIPPAAFDVVRLPRAYALLKLLFLPGGELRLNGAEPEKIRSEAAIPALLRSGRLSEALHLAVRRLRAHGFVPLAGTEGATFADPARLAASLVFPVGRRDGARLARLVLVRKTLADARASPAASSTVPEPARSTP
ncbi:MAG: type I-U CRISPR-associated protein Csx17 [Candidatus Thermoplasmatota archaeon]